MPLTISRNCPHCKQFVSMPVREETDLFCPQCAQILGRVEQLEGIFERCPLCQCNQFYVQKDFNQLLGCFIMLIGIIGVPWTYGLSLPVFALVDWFIYKRIPTIAVCYQCDAEFRGFVVPARFKVFMHHIGEKYDRKRSKEKE